MYGFLVLLPLTLVSVVIGILLLSSPQLSDYVDFVTQVNLPEGQTKWEFYAHSRKFWSLTASHLVVYVAMCFVLVATVRTVSNPLPDERSGSVRAFQMLLEATFVSIPSSVLLWICARALIDDTADPLLWLMTTTLVVGLVACIAVTLRRLPLELYTSKPSSFAITVTDGFGLLILVLIGSVGVAYALWPRESAEIIGMFPVLMLATATAFLAISAVFSRYNSPVAIISSLTTAVIFLTLIDQFFLPKREFRHTVVNWKATDDKRTKSERIKAQRQIPKLPDAFREWLEHRRPAIEAYNAKGQAYPIFFASAQGGGMYAAYHPALTLARLTDACPEFAHHLFGMSSVSGGSLGAAVFAEGVRSLPKSPLYDASSPNVGCTDPGRLTIQNTPLETSVSDFFGSDLLSPVVASAFIFDIPSLFLPQLRFGHDRARALESGIEIAWSRGGRTRADLGMSADFYGRWKPQEIAPALFMATTGVNFGVPVLLSQIDFSRTQAVNRPRRSLTMGPTAAPTAEASDQLKMVRDRFAQSGQTVQVGIANILDFRPDLQLAMSTAAALSARFPFVTPPGVIKAHPKIEPAQLYQTTDYLELTDGGFYDNSGGVVAREVMGQMQLLLERDPAFVNFKERVALTWIRFTHTPARRQVSGNEGGNFELFAPIVAFEAVRQSRGAFQLSPPRGVRTIDLYLLDEWYEGTLNWLLSHGTKSAIERRSSWQPGHLNEECCDVRHLGTGEIRRIPLDWNKIGELQNGEFEFKKVIPNGPRIQHIFDLIKNGVALTSTASISANP